MDIKHIVEEVEEDDSWCFRNETALKRPEMVINLTNKRAQANSSYDVENVIKPIANPDISQLDSYNQVLVSIAKYIDTLSVVSSERMTMKVSEHSEEFERRMEFIKQIDETMVKLANHVFGVDKK